MEAKNSIIDDYGRYILDTDSAIELMLQGKDISSCFFVDNEDVLTYNTNVRKITGEDPLKIYSTDNLSLDEFHDRQKQIWFTPWEYTLIDIKQELLTLCETEIERKRVSDEYDLFEQNDMINLLRFLWYFIDVVRSNNIIIGVGRGSSVSLYSLYLLGIHKVDSIRYGLDYNEFFK